MANSYQGKTYIFESGKLYEFNQTTRYTLLSASPWYMEWTSELQVLNGELYIAGGRTDFENATTQVLIYNFASGVWRQGAPLNKLRHGAATAVANSKLYVFGGNYSNDTAEVFNTNTNLWTYIASNSSLGVAFDTAVASGKHIFVAVSEVAANATVLRNDPLLNTWAKFTLIVPSRSYKNSFLYKGKIYLIGGNDNAGSSANVSSFYISDDSELYVN
ncbi:MAG TPA: kelch repeat-containing protein [Cellvibrio sp.]|nr:kelch repeat-containing protein [Cellvibrio sp.]